MNPLKKSQAKNILLVLTTAIIIGVAFLRHPSLKPMLSFNSQQTWQGLFAKLESGEAQEAQELWVFREFFSRGTIYLAKNQDDMACSTWRSEIKKNAKLTARIDQYCN